MPFKLDQQSMIRVLVTAWLGIFSSIAFTQNSYDAVKTRTMLLRAVAAVKVDKVAAIAMFAKGEHGFHDGDIYVFCFYRSTGKLLAGQNAGTEVQTLKSSTGDRWGLRIYNAGQRPAGEITQLSYMAPKPGQDRTEVSKVSWVTAADEQIACGVGYYP